MRRKGRRVTGTATTTHTPLARSLYVRVCVCDVQVQTAIGTASTHASLSLHWRLATCELKLVLMSYFY